MNVSQVWQIRRSTPCFGEGQGIGRRAVVPFLDDDDPIGTRDGMGHLERQFHRLAASVEKDGTVQRRGQDSSRFRQGLADLFCGEWGFVVSIRPEDLG